MGSLILVIFFIFAMFLAGIGVLIGGMFSVTLLERTNSAWSLVAIPLAALSCVVVGVATLWVMMSSG